MILIPEGSKTLAGGPTTGLNQTIPTPAGVANHLQDPVASDHRLNSVIHPGSITLWMIRQPVSEQSRS